jgi:flagellar motility protein MotE (MotC chaperone)
MILAIFLAASGALRLGSGVGKALAESPTPALVGEISPAANGTCPETPVALAQALAARTAVLGARELALEDRLAALKLANVVIDKRIAALKAAEAELSATLSQADGAAEADLARLTEVYETMKPKDAAALFQAMDPEFAAGFLGRMRPDAAAQVMAGMSSDAAYGVSVLLAGRNALVPKN